MKYKIAASATLVLLLGLGVFLTSKYQTHQTEMASSEAMPQEVRDDFYTSQVQSIFTARCIACHACYNAPCQMNLTSFNGFKRGASKANPYDFPLVEAQSPTRLDVDAKTESAWRKRGFFSVEPNNWFLRLVQMKNANSDQHQQYDAETSRTCPDPQSLKETNRYSFDLAYAGMPYGLPKLTSTDQETLSKWFAMGTPGPNAAADYWFKSPQAPGLKEEIKGWEDKLNLTLVKERLSARYLYEHLFIAHIYFQSTDKEFFRLVRARNLEGYPDEIATVRPFDDPKEVFFYRFAKVDGAIVSKTHTIFKLSTEMQRQYSEEFLGGKWGQDLKRMPPYGIAGANPFVTFSAIPRKTRYQFFLTNARYFIMTFMKGPVCRGQTALNVINDHFWVMFMDPKTDVTTLDNPYFKDIEHLMDAPASVTAKPFEFKKLREDRWQANRKKIQYYKDNKIALNLQSIWDGGRTADPNALLTVYRHYDSSDVRFGAEGNIPKTIWVIDYQIFEDIYYNLVAGYNVFGAVKHQVESRLYMELSRISSEDMFLSFLPSQYRERLRDQWSHENRSGLKARAADVALGWVGMDVSSKMKEDYKYEGQAILSDVRYDSVDVKLELLQHLFSTRLSAQVKERPDAVNRTELLPSEALAEPASVTIAKKFSPMLGKPAKYIAAFPDSSLVKVKGKDGHSYVYTLVHNKEHSNVNLMMFEDLRREPAKDTLVLVPGYATSYPNFYYVMGEDDIEDFVANVQRVPGLGKEQPESAEFSRLALKDVNRYYGVSRHNARFWEVHDEFNALYRVIDPIEAGYLDLNRYENY